MAEPMQNDELFAAVAESEPDANERPLNRTVPVGDGLDAGDDADIEADEDQEEADVGARASGRRVAPHSDAPPPAEPRSARNSGRIRSNYALAERGVLRAGDIVEG